MNQMTRTLLLIFTPVLLLAKEATVEQLFNVRTVKVKKESIASHSKSYGYVVPDQSRIYDISPRFGGYIVRLFADQTYRRVKKGEPLAIVYSPEVLKAKDEYLNTFKYTRKRPDKGMLESARSRLRLLGVSRHEIDDVISSQKVSSTTTIHAPVDGYLFIKAIEKGGAFDAKQRLFQIIDLDEVWVEAKLFEKERATVSTTERYEITFKGLEKVYLASSRSLYPDMDPKEATLTLRLQVKNTEHDLFPGMYAKIVSSEKESAQLLLPSSAVIRKDGKHYVFMVGGFKGEYEPLEVGLKVIDANTYAVTKGLKEGDEVVDNALFMMDSDAQINSLY